MDDECADRKKGAEDGDEPPPSTYWGLTTMADDSPIIPELLLLLNEEEDDDGRPADAASGDVACTATSCSLMYPSAPQVATFPSPPGTGEAWKTLPRCPVRNVARGWTVPGRQCRMLPLPPPIMEEEEEEEEEEDEYNDDFFFAPLLLQTSTVPASAFTGIRGLENGVHVALPPGRGDAPPMDMLTSQNFTSTSSPDVRSCVGHSVALPPATGDTAKPPLEECDDDDDERGVVDILHPQSSHDAVLMHPPCLIDDDDEATPPPPPPIPDVRG
jgi:hypothetical protein